MKIIFPIPSTDFDPTETAVPWSVITDAGHEVIFATPEGKVAVCDSKMIDGKGLLFWSGMLRAEKPARDLYAKMVASDSFQNPISWNELDEEAIDGLILAGGHAKGMREYLESKAVQKLAADLMASEKPIGAICHGVIVMARSKDNNGHSILKGRKTTSLTRFQELSASIMTFWLGSYYRTYPQTVEAEVRAAVGKEGIYSTGPLAILRDNPEKLQRGFVVQDGNYISSRWPGDAYRFSNAFLELLS